VNVPNNATLNSAKQWLTSQLSNYEALPTAWQKQTKTSGLLENYQQNQQAMKRPVDDEKKSLNAN